MTRVAINPALIKWARTRARLELADLVKKFPKLHGWEAGDNQPTLKQLEAFAKATMAPIGYFFLPEPPLQKMPIPDFRTLGDRPLAEPSPNLLETIYLCQQRQAWYRDYALVQGLPMLAFIGSETLDSDVEAVADRIRETLGFSVQARRNSPTWQEALREFISQADACGIMVMCSSVVLNNNHRRLDVDEFRGLAIADEYAPLVFINGADSKSAQMFTLAHELAHLWLGQSGVSDVPAKDKQAPASERWCNQVAAELLVPMRLFRPELRNGEELAQTLPRLARHFKVSTLVVLRRLHDAGILKAEPFWNAYRAEAAKLAEIQRSKNNNASGGDFFASQTARVSKRFAQALVSSTLEGQMLYRDAMRMVGVSQVETFHRLGRKLGFTF